MATKEMKPFLRETLEFIRDLIIIVLIVVFIRSYLFMPFQINGQSMYNSYYDKEFIIVDRFSYLDIAIIGKQWAPNRGDVVVFRPGIDKDKEYFIKRVIGLPGETIKIEWWKVYLLDDESWEYAEIIEDYLDENNKNKTSVRWSVGKKVFEIPEEGYFVMGDNRNASTDGRTCFSSCSSRTHYITKDNMIGKVWVDLGYFDLIDSIYPFKLGSLSFTHPELSGIDTSPKWLSSPGEYDKYEFIK